MVAIHIDLQVILHLPACRREFKAAQKAGLLPMDPRMPLAAE